MRRPRFSVTGMVQGYAGLDWDDVADEDVRSVRELNRELGRPVKVRAPDHRTAALAWVRLVLEPLDLPLGTWARVWVQTTRRGLEPFASSFRIGVGQQPPGRSSW